MRCSIRTKLPLCIAGGVILSLLASSYYFSRKEPFLIKNMSSSERRGFYVVRPNAGVERGELVVLTFPEKAKRFLHTMPWLHEDVPLLKRVGAVENDVVCHEGGVLSVNGEAVVRVLERNREGRTLLSKKGCYKVPEGEFLPLNTYSEYSFDGRYFGSVSRELII